MNPKEAITEVERTAGVDAQKAWDAVPLIPLGEAPDELTGIPYRLVIAKRALLGTYDCDEPDLMVKDMLSDLRHVCDALGLDYALLDRQAHANYVNERNEERYLAAK